MILANEKARQPSVLYCKFDSKTKSRSKLTYSVVVAAGEPVTETHAAVVLCLQQTLLPVIISNTTQILLHTTVHQNTHNWHIKGYLCPKD